MKKGYRVSLFCVVLLAFMIAALPAYAKGGIGPMLGSCCLGPRVGQEMNEDVDISVMEVLPLVPYVGGLFRLWLAYDYGYRAAGGKGFLASCCIGPRVGKEFKERKIRSMEYFYFIPVIQLYPWLANGIEAYSGKTMTEIEKEENLKR